MKIGKKWLQMAEMYKKFAMDYSNADFSEQAARDMYRHETFGEAMPIREGLKINGFELGKKWMDVTVAGWKEEIPQLGLTVSELQAAGYPDWFLERIGVFHLQPTVKDCSWWLTSTN